MILALFLVNYELRPADYLLAKTVAAHHSLNRCSVEIKLVTLGAVNKETSTYSLAYDRAQGADLTIRRPKPFRIVVTQDQMFEFDQTSNQYAVKSRIDGDLSSVLKHSASVLDELVASLVDAEGVKLWLSALRKNGSWSFKQMNGLLAVESKADGGQILVAVDPSTKLLRKVLMNSSGFGTEWTFEYGQAPQTIAFSPPKGSYKTSDIRPEIGQPTYGSAEARKIVQKMFVRYDNPGFLAYRVQSGPDETSVWYKKGSVRQTDGTCDWTWINRKFTMVDLKNNRAVVGTASRADVINAVATTGSRVEAMLQLILRGINPMRFYLGQSANVVLTGTIKADGKVCSILEVNSRGSKLSVIVRNDDGFVVSLMSTPANDSAANGAPKTYKELPIDGAAFAVRTTHGMTTETVEDYVKRTSP